MANKSKKFYITTSIPYTNAPPHIGFAFEAIQADVVARYRRHLGEDVYFLAGTDEHGLKTKKEAELAGKTPEAFADEMSQKFRDLKGILNLSNDDFIRTTDKKRHWPAVKKLWEAIDKNGDFYKKKYKGFYCPGCEAFKTEKEIIDGKCVIHQKPVEVVQEENYFFRLSKYLPKIKEIIKKNKIKIIPESKKNEILGMIENGLEDVSFSRVKEKYWGIPVPKDESQIIYVWGDALPNYISAIGYADNEKNFKKLWPADVHCIGKDIVKFHALYWPAMLLSAGLALPKSIFVHGFINVDGQKMSKSLGNVINPSDIVDKYNAEVLRYFLLRLSPFEDGDFSEKTMVERINEELVSNFSNLFYRVTSFIENNFDGKVPAENLSRKENDLLKSIQEKEKDYNKSFEELKLNDALSSVMELSSLLNKYFQEKKPWESIKNNKKDCAATLYLSVNVLKDICILLYPFLPKTAEKSIKLLDCKLDAKQLGKFSIKKGQKIKSEMLFKNIEYKESKQIIKEESIEMKEDMLPFKEFQKVDLRV